MAATHAQRNGATTTYMYEILDLRGRPLASMTYIQTSSMGKDCGRVRRCAAPLFRIGIDSLGSADYEEEAVGPLGCYTAVKLSLTRTRNCFTNSAAPRTSLWFLTQQELQEDLPAIHSAHITRSPVSDTQNQVSPIVPDVLRRTQFSNTSK